MLNGKADMLWNCGNAIVVLPKRPRATAFSCETPWGMGIQSKLLGGSRPDVRIGLVDKENGNIKERSKAAYGKGRAAAV